MLRIPILSNNVFKNIDLDPLKNLSFKVIKKYIYCQPCIYSKECSSTKSTNQYNFLPSNENFLNSLHTSFGSSIPFNNFGIRLKDINYLKYLKKNKNANNGDIFVVSMEANIFYDNSLKLSSCVKQSKFHKVILLEDDNKLPSAHEKEISKFKVENLKKSSESNKNNGSNKDKKDPKNPSLETLLMVQQHLNENMPRLLSEKHDYSIYHKEVEFVNNWSNEKSYTTVGTMQYRLELAKLKLYVHVRMTSVKVTLLHTSVDQSENCVKVRWRISGIPHSTTLRKLFENNADQEVQDEWLDGFSTFYVAIDGLICKHVMDKISPHERPAKEGLMEKLARGMTLSS